MKQKTQNPTKTNNKVATQKAEQETTRAKWRHKARGRRQKTHDGEKHWRTLRKQTQVKHTGENRQNHLTKTRGRTRTISTHSDEGMRCRLTGKEREINTMGGTEKQHTTHEGTISK